MSNFETLNCGEWSEVYAFLKTVVDRKLKGGDHDLNFIENEWCSIVSVHKKQQKTNQELLYILKDDSIEVCNGIKKKRIPIKMFQQMSQHLLQCIKTNTKRTFVVPQLQKFLLDLNSPKTKASSYEKKDIVLTIKEPMTQLNETYGFSIKSNLSKANSTLLNASAATNFTYKVDGDVSCYNNLKAKKLLQQIKSIQYVSMDSNTFHNNLQLIDTQFPEVISKILLYYYQGKGTSLEDLVQLIEKENPLHLKNNKVYRAKVGDFLLSIALGMMPNTRWNRMYDADGGMLVIREDGEIISFYIFKQTLLEELKEYLIINSYLDTPSTTRHKFGRLYQDRGQTKLKLNLQIRLYPH